jgi:pyridoxine kinase
MPVALILSSFVVANRIGGGAQQLVMAALGVEAFLAPTVLLGRNPARGAAGEAVTPRLFEGLIEGLEAEGLFARADVALCGYFASAAQVGVAADAIARVRAASPRVVVVVDPIMGDHPKGLYVPPDVAEAIAARLVPEADWITPNAWELAHLARREVATATDAAAAARRLGARALVTSTLAGEGEIGVLLRDRDAVRLYAHPRRPRAPNGTGDLIAAVFAAGLSHGLAPAVAAEQAAAITSQMVEAAGEGDLPLETLPRVRLRAAAGLRIEALP